MDVRFSKIKSNFEMASLSIAMNSRCTASQAKLPIFYENLSLDVQL